MQQKYSKMRLKTNRFKKEIIYNTDDADSHRHFGKLDAALRRIQDLHGFFYCLTFYSVFKAR